MTKKTTNEIKGNNTIKRTRIEVPQFAELIHRFERSISILGRSACTFKNYGHHVTAMAVCIVYPAQTICKDASLWLFKQYLETTKVKGFAEKTSCNDQR